MDAWKQDTYNTVLKIEVFTIWLNLLFLEAYFSKNLL